MGHGDTNTEQPNKVVSLSDHKIAPALSIGLVVLSSVDVFSSSPEPDQCQIICYNITFALAYAYSVGELQVKHREDDFGSAAEVVRLKVRRLL